MTGFMAGVPAQNATLLLPVSFSRLGEVDTEESQPLSDRLVADTGFTEASAIALIIFTMLYAPCFVTVVTMARESSWKWAAYSVFGSTGLAFVMAVLGYNVTRAFM